MQMQCFGLIDFKRQSRWYVSLIHICMVGLYLTTFIKFHLEACKLYMLDYVAIEQIMTMLHHGKTVYVGKNSVFLALFAFGCIEVRCAFSFGHGNHSPGPVALFKDTNYCFMFICAALDEW